MPMRSRARTRRRDEVVQSATANMPRNRLKAMAQAFQLGSEFQMVVDLAIEDDGRFPVVACYRLIAAHEIDDLQAGCAERADVRTIYALLVRASVDKRRGGYLNAPGVGRPVLMGKASDATQNAEALLQ